MLITGCCDNANETRDGAVKTGLHLKMPNLFVEEEQALLIRAAFVRQLHDTAHADPQAGVPSKPWNEIVDEAVFSQHRTLRMLYSRKVSNKYVDMGRVYQILAVVDSDGTPNDEQLQVYLQDPVQLLRDASIRTQHTQQKPTPGFSQY